MRTPFRGVQQVIRFNWPQYVVAIVVVTATGACALFAGSLPSWVVTIAAVTCAVVLWWIVVSLIATWWIYDRSPLCRWEWIAAELAESPRHWINIHSGYDEASDALARMFPDAAGRVFDFYDEKTTREPSIERARKLSGSKLAAERVDCRRLPAEDGCADLVTVLMAAHELRDAGARSAFFGELRRVATAGRGRIIVVEHLRDAANCLAYGPGFWHFLSRLTWLSAIHSARLSVRREFRMTPFIRIFVLEARAT